MAAVRPNRVVGLSSFLAQLNIGPTMLDPQTLGPGTILAFSGRTRTSRLIEAWTCSRYSHVAVVVWLSAGEVLPVVVRLGDDTWPWYDWVDGAYVIESTTLHFEPCLISGHKINGVQVHALDSLLAYEGRVWALRPVVPLSSDESYRLTKAALPLIGVPYDTDGAAIAGSRWAKFWPCLKPKVSDRQTYYCCELVGDVWQKALGNRWLPEFEPGTLSPTELVSMFLRAVLVHEPERVK